MRYTLAIAVCWSLLLAACGTDGEDTAGSSLTATSATTSTAGETLVASTTSASTSTPSSTLGGVSVDYSGLAALQEVATAAISTTATTALSLPPEAATGPDFLWHGPFGLIRVERGIPTILWDQGPVQWAADDLEGGVMFMPEEQPILMWQRVGQSEPVEVERESGYWHPGFTGILDGAATLFYSGVPIQIDPDTWPCADWALNGYALPTGDESTFICLPMEDAGYDIGSFGGGLFVGAPYGQCGGDYTYDVIEFWDRSGTEVEVASNPFPSGQGCAPCELAARISDDGNLLAYRYRPDAFWPDSDNFPTGPRVCTGDHDGWWEKSQLIPAVVAVVDLTTGEEMWSTEIGADVQLGDFDGRHVVLHRWDWSNHVWVDIRIVDTWGEHPAIYIGTPSVVSLLGRGR
ncbi:MAG: hypothetical protein P1T08_12130 [Acidimicrobiia bacterium]|nr:hypothetical protein [Acidimicrobiia bacterium]